MEEVSAAIDAALGPRGFTRRAVPPLAPGQPGLRALWVRRRLNTNRGVALLEAPEGEDAATWARTQRWPAAKAGGFFPLLYTLGLQAVVLGGRWDTRPALAVDGVDNQWCVLQAIHLVDLESRTLESGATWGQVVSGPDQDALVEGLSRELSLAPRETGEPTLDRATPPTWWIGLLLAGGLVAGASALVALLLA